MRLSEFDCTLHEAKIRKDSSLQPQVTQQPVTAELETCQFFDESTSVYKKNIKMREKISAFMDFKKANPLDPFNKTDKSVTSNGPFAMAIPGMRKAHLNSDLSIWYAITGSKPTLVQLYAVLTHEQSGTGTPPKISKQLTVANKMKQQTFTRI